MKVKFLLLASLAAMIPAAPVLADTPPADTPSLPPPSAACLPP
jgi:hypothetical protein